MSGSPKYTRVRVSAAQRQRDQKERARRAAERRRRQAARAARQRELAARQRARAQERTRRDREREARQLQASLEDGRNAVSSRLAGIRSLLDDAGTGDTRALRAELDDLQIRIQAGTDLAGYERAAEALRARAADLQRGAAGAASPVTPAGRSQLISELRQRLLAVPAGDVPADQGARCGQLITALEAAAAESAEVRFEALVGTAEQAIASLEWRAQQTAADRRLARPVPVAPAASAPAGTGQDEDELADIADRLKLIRAAAEGAIADAAAFGETELGRMLQDTLHAAVAAVSAGPPAEASARVARLDEVLLGAEATLDDSQAAHERRTDLAAALQDLLADHGMTFLGGSDEGRRFLLQFERPSGAIYTATISDADDGELALSYAIDGEQDVPVLPAPNAAVCDQTESFLEAVHADLAGRGFEAGELLWDGKPGRRQPLPPGNRAQPLPSSETPRRRHG